MKLYRSLDESIAFKRSGSLSVYLALNCIDEGFDYLTYHAYNQQFSREEPPLLAVEYSSLQRLVSVKSAAEIA